MSTPTDSQRDELRALRARAYGPDADIGDDPAALARLQQLEAGERAAAPTSTPAPMVVEDTPDAATPAASTRPRVRGVADQPTAPDAAGDAAPPYAPESASFTDRPASGDGIPGAAAGLRHRWWRRHFPLLWAASVVAALVLGAALTLWTQSLDVGHIAVLHEDPDADWPTEVWGGPTDGALAFDSFHGLLVLSQPQPARGDGDISMPCIIVYSERNGAIDYASGTCGAGPFPATAAMIVDSSSPADLRDAFALGTSLQFVLDGDEVHVYAKGPELVARTP